MHLGILYNPVHADHLFHSGTLAPLFRWRSLLRDCGIFFCVRSCCDKKILDCDTVLVIDFIKKPDHVSAAEAEILHRLRAGGRRVVFFDNTDSCGTTQFSVLPFTDLYLKRQLYKDRLLYCTKHYGLRLYTDYIHKRFGITDPVLESRSLLAEADISRIAVGWNAGLGNHRLSNRLLIKANKISCLGIHTFPLWFDTNLTAAGRHTKVSLANRHWAVHYRGNTSYLLNTIAYGRNKVRDVLAGVAPAYPVCTGPGVKRRRFLAELRQSRVVISPFGYGEICIRDFETFIAGCLLLKPDMRHLETWPDYYIPEQTYCPYSWHGDDLADTLNDILKNDIRADIARAGSQMYADSLSRDGGEKFCARLQSLFEQSHQPESRKVG